MKSGVFTQLYVQLVFVVLNPSGVFDDIIVGFFYNTLCPTGNGMVLFKEV